MNYIEAKFPEYKVFMLDTPLTNKRTNSLYKKCGYIETARDEDTVSYRKEIKVNEN